MTHTGSRKELILEQATRLFSIQGFDGTSMRDIARASGITQAAIYRHFDSKFRLYEDVIRAKAKGHSLSDLHEQCSERDDIETILSRIAHHILDLAAAEPQLMRLMFQNSLEQSQLSSLLFIEVRLPYISFLAGELERRIAAGELRKVDPFISSRCFVGMVMDCALNIGVWTKMLDSPFEAAEVICNNVPIFARGLMAEKAS